MMEAISEFGAEVADVAEIEERQLTDGLRAISFLPANSSAVGATLIVSASQVVVQIGSGGRFELDLDEEPLEILRAAAAGRVEETTRRFSVTTRVWLSDGTAKKTSVMWVADLWTRPSARRHGGKRASRHYQPWRPSAMREPILTFEGLDLMVFAHVWRAEAQVEPYDINDVDAYDAEGQVLRFQVEGRRTFLEETGEHDPDRLRAAVLATFDATGVAVGPDASLAELVRVASQQFSVG